MDNSSDKLSVPDYTYNRTAAVNYALRYWNTPNRAYTDYTSSATSPLYGGDCTNFTFQALKAGGWVQLRLWFWKSKGESCNQLTCSRSPSRTGAIYFYQYIAGTGTQYSETTEGKNRVDVKFRMQVPSWYSWSSTKETFRNNLMLLGLGDIVQQGSSTSSAGHSTAKELFVTYRNSFGNSPATGKSVYGFSSGSYILGYPIRTTAN